MVSYIEDNKVSWLIEAPNKYAVEKHHAKYGIKCEWIVQVKTTSTKQAN
jgi:hypothetical protein